VSAAVHRHVALCVCVCVCVRERERERVRERERERARQYTHAHGERDPHTNTRKKKHTHRWPSRNFFYDPSAPPMTVGCSPGFYAQAPISQKSSIQWFYIVKHEGTEVGELLPFKDYKPCGVQTDVSSVVRRGRWVGRRSDVRAGAL